MSKSGEEKQPGGNESGGKFGCEATHTHLQAVIIETKCHMFGPFRANRKILKNFSSSFIRWCPHHISRGTGLKRVPHGMQSFNTLSKKVQAEAGGTITTEVTEMQNNSCQEYRVTASPSQASLPVVAADIKNKQKGSFSVDYPVDRCY